MSEKSDGPFSPAGLARLREAAQWLAMSAPGRVGNDPHIALAALMLATVNVAIIVKMPYEGLLTMMADHYESVLLDEAKRELAAGEVMVDKPAGKV